MKGARERMSKQDLMKMFGSYEAYVEVVDDNKLYIKDFEGFDENWEEIIVDLPAIVMERLSVCELMGVETEYASADI